MILAQRISFYNAPVLQAPPEPPENVVTEQDRQDQQRYEQWLEQQNSILEQQKKHYESEINKLRKSRKVRGKSYFAGTSRASIQFY